MIDIQSNFKDFNVNWLMTGKGSMIIKNEGFDASSHSHTEKNYSPSNISNITKEIFEELKSQLEFLQKQIESVQAEKQFMMSLIDRLMPNVKFKGIDSEIKLMAA